MDEALLEHLDHAAAITGMTRSELFRLALQDWLDGQRWRQLVVEDRAGYEANPVRPNEFEGLIAAQAVDVDERFLDSSGGTLARAGRSC